MDAIALIGRATTPKSLFGDHDLEGAYRRLAREVHPDVSPSPEAAAAFATLRRLYEEALRQQADGTYDEPPVVDGLTLTGPVVVGDISAVYPTDDPRLVCKVAADPGYNDLLDVEAEVLPKLSTASAGLVYRSYLPVFDRALQVGPLRANVLERLPGCYTLEDVRRRLPGGVEPRSVAWMLNRLLEILGWIHGGLSYVHGAVLPGNVMVSPETHGLVLIDWCWATAVGSKPRAYVARSRASYPGFALNGGGALPATDIYMAAGCAEYLLGHQPHPLQAFLRGCRLEGAAYCPADAWAVRDEFARVLERLYGPPTWHPFVMPKQESDGDGHHTLV